MWLSDRILGDGVTDLVEEVEDDLGLVALKPADALDEIESQTPEPPRPEKDPESTG